MCDVVYLQVTALCVYPELMKSPDFPEDTKEHARTILGGKCSEPALISGVMAIGNYMYFAPTTLA